MNELREVKNEYDFKMSFFIVNKHFLRKSPSGVHEFSFMEGFFLVIPNPVLSSDLIRMK